MHVENRICHDSDKLRELSAEHALLRSYQHERTQKTPPCAISRRPRMRRPEQLLQKRPQSLSWGSNYLGGQDCDRSQSSSRYDQSSRYGRPKNMPVDGPSYLVRRTDGKRKIGYGTYVLRNYRCLWTGPKQRQNKIFSLPPHFFAFHKIYFSL